MKGNEKVLEVLNQLLSDEMTAINQYMVHSEMCDNWGYEKLHKSFEKNAVDEMHHAEWLIKRILFLEGTPIVTRLGTIRVGKTIPEMIANDYQGELAAIRAYNLGIDVAREADDEGSANLMTEILKMEEGHADWEESQRDQIEQMGLENYLSIKTEA
jgi:bacterioferritin